MRIGWNWGEDEQNTDDSWIISIVRDSDRQCTVEIVETNATCPQQLSETWERRLESLCAFLDRPTPRKRQLTDDSIAVVRVSRRFEAEPHRVFDAWLDPALAGRFLFATPTGTMITVEIDAQIGGRFTFIEHRPDQGDIEHVGEYLSMAYPSLLVFTFAVPEFSDDYTTVTVEIAPAGTGSDLTLTHEGVLPDYERQTAQGWTTILNALARTLGEAAD